MLPMSNEPSSDLESLVLTPYGYGVVTQTRDALAQVKLQWGATAYLSLSLLHSEVTVFVKLFMGDRALQKHTMGLTQPFETLQTKLAAELGLSNSFSLKLIYPMGRLKSVQPNDTPFSLNLPLEAKLVVVVQQTFVWDEKAKGENIEILNAGRSAVKRTEEDYETVLTNAELTRGKHCWDIIIDRYMRHEDIFIGVAQKTLPLVTRPPETGMFWGYLCTG
jgi:hypothetical protein